MFPGAFLILHKSYNLVFSWLLSNSNFSAGSQGLGKDIIDCLRHIIENIFS